MRSASAATAISCTHGHACQTPSTTFTTGSFTAVFASPANTVVRVAVIEVDRIVSVERVDPPVQRARCGAAHVQTPTTIGAPDERGALQRFGTEPVALQHAEGLEAHAVTRRRNDVRVAPSLPTGRRSRYAR